MFKYSVKIKKTRGKINENNKPNQTLTIKSKTRKNKNELFNEAADYLNKKYNLTLESADVNGGETIKVYVLGVSTIVVHFMVSGLICQTSILLKSLRTIAIRNFMLMSLMQS